MAMLFGGGRINSRTPPATSLRVQTSLNGQPIAIVHGRARLAVNLVDYVGFASSGGSGGGKGGVVGTGGKGTTQTSYSADIVAGLCEGPIAAVGTVWSGQMIETLATAGFSVFTGTDAQAAWGFLSASYPNHALGYSYLAYVAAAPLPLGGSPELPNLNLEVTGGISCAVTETATLATPDTVTPAHFTLASSVTEQAMVPATSPYQVQAQNHQAANHVLVSSGAIKGSQIIGSDSQGVIDVNGRVFTRVAGAPTSGQYSVTAGGLYTFAAADAGLSITIIDLAVAPGVSYGIAPGGTALAQVLDSPGGGQFTLSVQPGSYGQYQFSAADDRRTILIIDVPDADPAASLADYLSNARYGCGFPSANIGDFTVLQNYAYAAGLFISPALNSARSANAWLKDFATGINGEFVWSSGKLTFIPYGDAAISGFGKSYTPPSAAAYTLDDDDFLKNEGTAGVGVSAFTSADPVACVRKQPSDAHNNIKVEYLDRGNSYNPVIVEAKDDAAINAYGLRAADTKQLHFFCDESAALMSAQLQLGRQQVRNLYSFTVPWYFILLDPMDIVAISDSRLGLDQQWVRILEITENQQDGSLAITAEEYLAGAGSAPGYASQPRLGYELNANLTPSSVN